MNVKLSEYLSSVQFDLVTAESCTKLHDKINIIGYPIQTMSKENIDIDTIIIYYNYYILYSNIDIDRYRNCINVLHLCKLSALI